MRNPSFLLAALSVATLAWSQPTTDDLVLVKGGPFVSSKSNYHGKNVTLADFYIGRYEVTQREWSAVMGDNPSTFKGDNRPVEMISWYDCVDYCNRRSLKEGLQPYYTIDKKTKDPRNQNDYDELKWTVTINPGANGYRLPTEAEWEYAGSGGQLSKSYVYSGSDDVKQVGWFWQNAGNEPLVGAWNWPIIEKNRNQTKPIGEKQPNELGLYDMSGNVREWCWDWHGELSFDGAEPKGSHEGFARVWKGGGWMGGDFCCEPAFRGSHEPHSLGYDQGFRVCRSK